MKLPPRKSTLFLSCFLCLHGGMIILRLEQETLLAISGLLALAAGGFLWVEK